MSKIRSIIYAATQILGEKELECFADIDTDQIWSPLHNPITDTSDNQDDDQIRVKLDSNSIMTTVARDGSTAMVNNITSHPKWSENYNPDVDILHEVGSTFTCYAH